MTGFYQIVAGVVCLAALWRGADAASSFPMPTMVSSDQFVRARCSTKESVSSLVAWRGSGWTHVPGEKQEHLFDVIGMNVIRCIFNETTGWSFTSRELEYYVDPQSGEPMYSWKNPWTHEVVNVAHVANSPVQFPLGNYSLPATTAEAGEVAILLDTPLFYPNPLFANKTFEPYAAQQNYEAHEIFKFFAPLSEINSGTSAPSMHFSWTRVSQWLPWMKMEGRKGGMVFTASGQRTTYDNLPAWMSKDIKERLPLYSEAPPCYLKASSMTSWDYFAQNFDSYLSGDQFPLPAAEEPSPQCA